MSQSHPPASTRAKGRINGACHFGHGPSPASGEGTGGGEGHPVVPQGGTINSILDNANSQGVVGN